MVAGFYDDIITIMKILKTGEFGLIKAIDELVSEHYKGAGGNLKLGIGDDAAVWQTNGETQLISTDCLVQDVHFTTDTISWRELGKKSLAVNMSDIAAMGGSSDLALISLAIPKGTEQRDVLKFYEGALEICKEYNTYIAGGDMSSSPLIMVSVTIIGSMKEGIQPLTRKGAKPGDKLALTGYTGLSAAGLRVLSEKRRINPEYASTFKKAFLSPEPKILAGRALAKYGASSAIDISDGLLADATHIAEDSGVEIDIYTESIPLHPCLKQMFSDEALDLALSGGEDYEILFTADNATMQKLRTELSPKPYIIGEVTEGKRGRINLRGNSSKTLDIKRRGWNHFA